MLDIFSLNSRLQSSQTIPVSCMANFSVSCGSNSQISDSSLNIFYFCGYVSEVQNQKRPASQTRIHELVGPRIQLSGLVRSSPVPRYFRQTSINLLLQANETSSQQMTVPFINSYLTSSLLTNKKKKQKLYPENISPKIPSSNIIMAAGCEICCYFFKNLNQFRHFSAILFLFSSSCALKKKSLTRLTDKQLIYNRLCSISKSIIHQCHYILTLFTILQTPPSIIPSIFFLVTVKIVKIPSVLLIFTSGSIKHTWYMSEPTSDRNCIQQACN